MSGRWVLRDDDDELAELLRGALRLLLRHPVAAQAAFRALVAEGRAFAETPEGARLRERLGASELIRRGRVVWDVVSLNLLEEHPDGALPSQYLDALVMTAGAANLEEKLAGLFAEQGGDRDGDR